MGEFSSPWSIFCADSYFGIAVARKISPSFCQKCSWQVTAKHACTLRMWLCMKWCGMVHGYMVYAERVETAAVSCGTSHVTTKQHCKYSTLVDIENRAIQKVTVTHFESHATKAQRMNWRVERYIKVIIIIKGQWSAREQKSQHWPVWPLGSQFQPHVSLYHPAKAREKVCPVKLLCNKTCNSQSMLRPHFPIIQPRQTCLPPKIHKCSLGSLNV